MIKVIINTGRKLKEKPTYYRDVKADIDGWVDAKVYLPADFDLVYMKIKGKPTIVGWSVGKEWIGLRLKDDDEVLYWKKKSEENIK